MDPNLVFYIHVFFLWTGAVNQNGRPCELSWLRTGICFHLWCCFQCLKIMYSEGRINYTGSFLLTALCLSDGPWFVPVRVLHQGCAWIDLFLKVTRYHMDLVSWSPGSASLLEHAPHMIPTQECQELVDTASRGDMDTVSCQCSPAGWCSAAHSLPQVVVFWMLRQLDLHKDLFMGSVAGGMHWLQR